MSRDMQCHNQKFALFFFSDQHILKQPDENLSFEIFCYVHTVLDLSAPIGIPKYLSKATAVSIQVIGAPSLTIYKSIPLRLIISNEIQSLLANKIIWKFRGKILTFSRTFHIYQEKFGNVRTVMRRYSVARPNPKYPHRPRDSNSRTGSLGMNESK